VNYGPTFSSAPNNVIWPKGGTVRERDIGPGIKKMSLIVSVCYLNYLGLVGFVGFVGLVG